MPTQTNVKYSWLLTDIYERHEIIIIHGEPDAESSKIVLVQIKNIKNFILKEFKIEVV